MEQTVAITRNAVHLSNSYHSGVRVSLPIAPFLEPQIRGKDRMTGPAYSFLVTHNQSGRKLLFDLSVRKDCRTGFAPAVQQRVNDPANEFWVRWIDPSSSSSSSSPKWETTDTEPEAEPRDVVDMLAAGGLRPEDVEAVVWSHHHWDHTGDVTRFPAASTKLVVGPGFTQAFGAGWPAAEGVPVKGEEWAGRELVEVGFKGDGLRIGRFRAVDWWGDGSFYLLDTPGHAVGHLCGLARVRAEEGEGEGDGDGAFVFMGGVSFIFSCAFHLFFSNSLVFMSCFNSCQECRRGPSTNARHRTVPITAPSSALRPTSPSRVPLLPRLSRVILNMLRSAPVPSLPPCILPPAYLRRRRSLSTLQRNSSRTTSMTASGASTAYKNSTPMRGCLSSMRTMRVC